MISRPAQLLMVSMLAVLTAGCTPLADKAQAIDNAIAADLQDIDAAEGRAGHLDQLGQELSDQANKAGAAGTALRNESNADFEAAAELRAQEANVQADAYREGLAKVVPEK